MAKNEQRTAGQGDFDDARYYLWKLDSTEYETDGDRIVAGLRALTHATLSLTAVTAIRGMNDMSAPDYNSWAKFLVERAHPHS